MYLSSEEVWCFLEGVLWNGTDFSATNPFLFTDLTAATGEGGREGGGRGEGREGEREGGREERIKPSPTF